MGPIITIQYKTFILAYVKRKKAELPRGVVEEMWLKFDKMQ